MGAGPRTQAVGFALLKTPGRRGPESRGKGMIKGQWDEIELSNRAPGGSKWDGLHLEILGIDWLVRISVD